MCVCMYVCVYVCIKVASRSVPTSPIFLLLSYRTEFEALLSRRPPMRWGPLGQGIVVVKVVAIMLVMTVMILEIPIIYRATLAITRREAC